MKYQNIFYSVVITEIVLKEEIPLTLRFAQGQALMDARGHLTLSSLPPFPSPKAFGEGKGGLRGVGARCVRLFSLRYL